MRRLLAVGILVVLLMQSLPVSRAQDGGGLPHYTGYISVAPGGHYFVDELGQPFLVIGQNDGISWPGLTTLINQSSPASTEAYVRDLREHDITVSRIMVEYAEDTYTYLENPVGEFSPAIVQFWDDFIPMAETHGLYLLLTPYDTFWQARNWERYPYNAANGGPCATMRDWVTGAACIDAQKARWRFIIERWGGSPNIFAWDILNEIDIWWEATPAEIDAYVTDMADFIRELEIALYGKAHLLTVSSAAPNPGGALGEIIYNHPLLDFATTHQYVGPAVNDPGDDTISAAVAVAGSTILSRAAIRDARPYFDSESGPIDGWIANFTVDATYHHNMAWAHLMAGGAGAGMRWPYTWPHWIMPQMRDNLLGMARFAAAVDWSVFAPRSLVGAIEVDTSGILTFGSASDGVALIWLLADQRLAEVPDLAGVRLAVADWPAGRYTVDVWDTYAGRLLTSSTTALDTGSLEVVLPEESADLPDIALHIYPNES